MYEGISPQPTLPQLAASLEGRFRFAEYFGKLDSKPSDPRLRMTIYGNELAPGVLFAETKQVEQENTLTEIDLTYRRSIANPEHNLCFRYDRVSYDLYYDGYNNERKAASLQLIERLAFIATRGSFDMEPVVIRGFKSLFGQPRFDGFDRQRHYDTIDMPEN